MSSHGAWSYRSGEAKPSTALFRGVLESLARQGIKPEECLYVGNDIRNDIWPAGELGFRTALFAGDARSLRLRAEDPDCRDVRPDLVLTDLRQLLEVIG